MKNLLSKPLVIGASGLVGGAIFAELSARNYDVIGTYREHQKNDFIKFDMDKDDAEDFLSSIVPSCIFVAAARTYVDWCESHELETIHENVELIKPIALYCNKHNIPLIYFSTDYIFDGKDGPYDESAKPNPLNVYGKSKMLAEDVVLSAQFGLIVRITNVFDIGYDEKNFVYRAISTLCEGKELSVPTDQYSTQTYATYLAKQLVDLLEQGKICSSSLNSPRVINISCDALMSRYELALKLVELFNHNSGNNNDNNNDVNKHKKQIDKNLIVGFKTDKLGQAANRPMNGGLKNDLLKKLLDVRTIPVDEALVAVIKKYNDRYLQKA